MFLNKYNCVEDIPTKAHFSNLIECISDAVFHFARLHEIVPTRLSVQGLNQCIKNDVLVKLAKQANHNVKNNKSSELTAKKCKCCNKYRYAKKLYFLTLAMKPHPQK